jgi:nucleosome binding factor SPN SPT16 subunit
MAAEIKIDSKLFQERISHFVNAWKADKRAGDALFNGASSIVINMGKVNDENSTFYKNNAMHVSSCDNPVPHVVKQKAG